MSHIGVMIKTSLHCAFSLRERVLLCWNTSETKTSSQWQSGKNRTVGSEWRSCGRFSSDFILWVLLTVSLYLCPNCPVRIYLKYVLLMLSLHIIFVYFSSIVNAWNKKHESYKVHHVLFKFIMFIINPHNFSTKKVLLLNFGNRSKTGDFSMNGCWLNKSQPCWFQ